MSACEKCWDQAFLQSRLLGGSQVDHYQRLLVENETEHTDTTEGES